MDFEAIERAREYRIQSHISAGLNMIAASKQGPSRTASFHTKLSRMMRDTSSRQYSTSC